MIKRIENQDNVWELNFRFFGSSVYLLKIRGEYILIDTTSYNNQEELISGLEEINLKPSDINKLILTHNHWDHLGNLDLFKIKNKNLKIYASKKDFPEEKFPEIKKAEEVRKNFPELKIIKTPGHTPGSICIYYGEKGILFSGDTLFHNGIGRTDFFESSPKDMENSLEKLNSIDYTILCPGHNI